MNPARRTRTALLWATAVTVAGVPCPAQDAAELPPGVEAVWDLDHAHREATPTRERVSINGLWR